MSTTPANETGLQGYRCTECDNYHRHVTGYVEADGTISVECRFCGEVAYLDTQDLVNHAYQ